MPKNPKYQVATLDHLWWGISIGGRHYTGHVWHNHHRYEMERILSIKETKQYAAEMGMRAEARYMSRVSNKFESLEDLERCALAWCEKYLGDNWLLFDDNYYNPEKIIGGKGWMTEIIPAANELAAAWRKVPNSRRADPKVYQPIYAVWKKYVEKYAILPDRKRGPLNVEKLEEPKKTK